ncbi:hypothetical protein H6P81_001201 [Aristolochia fimbriata]|uniref:non-specific serine/threonine protein kinase n=1 Tax=Aristolochia fimbriata TaxID=158543 RepID=A0AAV7FAT9_ARIFI|nr:hypothetical protein H6P81_001201 [Aristolochia fimbriata]
MWRFKQFMPKEQTGLEGRTIDIGNFKVYVKNIVAEGGFSCVYVARDANNPSKQYALKHIICNDEESLDLVMKEVSVMKSLMGHPNVVTLYSHAIFDMGRTKEALLLMEFCEKSLVTVLEGRGTGYFEEKQILSIFRDVCNAVFALHSQSPPVAHRDLKAENVLLGPEGAWKLCDFGSTSTNHKRFDRPEEMGIEEDNIRKYTTPAYRAPEMWDLFRKEVISEKVDIWALGCLLYRICYFKSAFDGESKLQILNGNYRIPELPKYGPTLTNLICDMLEASPDNRPDITQVWFRVNEQLPPELQKELPESTTSGVLNEGKFGPPKRTPPLPRGPHTPPSGDQGRSTSPQKSKSCHGTPRAAIEGGPLGVFWSTLHAKDAKVSEDKGPIFDEPHNDITAKHPRRRDNNSPPLDHSNTQMARTQFRRSGHGNSLRKSDDNQSEDFEIRFFSEDRQHHGLEKPKTSNSDNVGTFQNETFNAFVAEFDNRKLSTGNKNNDNSGSRKDELESEVEKLKEQLNRANLEKAEITSKYEKLSAICRSQRQEIQELKNALAARSPSPNKDDSRIQNSTGSSLQREKIEGSIWELQQGMFATNSASSTAESNTWQAFSDESKPSPSLRSNLSKSVRSTNGHKNSQPAASSPFDNWGFGQDNFVATAAGSQISRTIGQGSHSQRFGEPKSLEPKQVSQPAGWAGF